MKEKIIEILLVEDNDGDVELVLEAFKRSKIKNNITNVGNGIEAISYLRKEGKYKDLNRPDLVILDLNLPIKDGRWVLTQIKSNEDLNDIPVIIMTSSNSQKDILNSYKLNANCYITKPLDLEEFWKIMSSIEAFWLSTVKLPSYSQQ
jgi:CheY-like chemotaxis protein